MSSDIDRQYLVEALRRDFLTISDIARKQGVSYARAYAMLGEYDVRVIRFGPRFTLVPVWEYEKIPKRRKYTKRRKPQ